MSVIIFLLVLFLLVLVHEWGHYITAKLTGMRVDEFAIGFPPKLFGIKKGETEYTFNALPIGGFVRIFGENPDADQEESPDKSRAFGSRPYWAQAVVLIAGVTMNVIFAWMLFTATFMVGVPTQVEEATASEQAVLYVSGVMDNSPAAGNIPVGAEVTKLQVGEAVLDNPTPTSFSEFIKDHSSESIEVSYRFDNTDSVALVSPTTQIIPDDADKAAVGVSLVMVETQSMSILGSAAAAAKMTYDGLIGISTGLYTLIVQSVKGTADFSQVAGPIGIVGMVGDAAAFGLTTLMTFTAMISLNLAVINMLPIPALDGGRLVFVAIEAITRKPINPVWTNRVNLIGFLLLMLLMVVVTWNDIMRLFN